MPEFNVPSEIVVATAVERAVKDLTLKLVTQLWNEASVRTLKRLEPRIEQTLRTIKTDEQFCREFRDITTNTVMSKINEGGRIGKWAATETPAIVEEALARVRAELVEKIAAKILGAFR